MTTPQWIAIISLSTCVALALVAMVLWVRGWRMSRSPEQVAMEELQALARRTWRFMRLLLVLIVGMTLVLVGLLMTLGPGPGVIILLFGLALLGTEFVWARRIMVRLHSTAAGMGQRLGVSGAASQPPPNKPVRRFIYRIAQGIRRGSERIGLSGLMRWLSRWMGIDAAIAEANAEQRRGEADAGNASPSQADRRSGDRAAARD